MNINNLPSQKLPKTQKDRDWKVNCGKALSMYSYANGATNTYSNKILEQFKIASGKCDYTSYTHITNPYNLVGDAYKKYPEKLRNHDFISPLFQKQISNFLKAPFNPVVYTKNSNFQNEKLQREKELINESLQQRFVNKLIETGQISNTDKVEELSPDQITSQINSMKDIDTITGQKILDYIIQRDNLKMQYSKEFYHFICSNSAFSFATVRNDNIIRYTVHPSTIDYSYTGSPLIDDANIVRARYRFSFEDVLELFQEHPDLEYYPKMLDNLEQGMSNYNSQMYGFLDERSYGTQSGVNQNLTRLIDVHHIQWTSFRKVGFVGEIEIDEDYDGYVDNWTWKEEIREIFHIDNAYFLGGDCLDYPIYDANNPFKAKKSYSGVIFMNDIVEQETLPYKILQYQEAFNVVQYKLQLMIAKYKGKIGVIPIGLLGGKGSGVANDGGNQFVVDVDDDKMNRDMSSQEEMNRLSEQTFKKIDSDSPLAKAMYRMDATNLLFVDESSDTAMAAIQLLKAIDLSDGNFIQFLIQWRQTIKEDGIALLGLNRFAQGDIGNRESVGNVQEGLAQAGAIIDLYYYYFEMYIANDLQRIVDFSKYAFKEGTNITYMRTNDELISLQVPKSFGSSSYGIFADDSRKVQQLLDIATSKATEMLQNGNKVSTVLKMLSSSRNFATIIEDVEKAEKEMQQQQQSIQQQQLESNQQIAQLESQDKQLDRDLKKYEIDVKAEIAIQQATLQAVSFESASNETDDYSKIAEQQIKAQKNVADVQLKGRELDIKQKDVEVKKYIADNQLKIAKENKG